MVNYFTEHESLIGKPKILFIQGLQPISYPECTVSNDFNRLETDSNQQANSGHRSFRIPKYADFLLFYNVNVSNTVQTLCQVLSESAHQYDLMTLLSIVCERIRSNNERSHEIPFINSTLTRLVSLTCNQFNNNNNNNTFPNKQTPSNSINHNEHKKNLFDNSSVCKMIDWENRGECYIFNYENFDNPQWQRRLGTEMDVNKLKQTFKELNFNIHHYNNDLTTLETLQKLKRLSRENFNHIQCLVICLLSHGEDNGILHCKDGTINRNDVINYLVMNKSLAGKPKFVFFQSCQGKQRDYGHETVTDCAICEDYNQNHNLNNYSITSSPVKHHNDADLFIFSSSYPGHYSYRNPRYGSWFIQALCHVLQLHNSEHDLATIAAKVCRIVGYNQQSKQKEKQIPFLYSTLSKPIKFRPPPSKS